MKPAIRLTTLAVFAAMLLPAQRPQPAPYAPPDLAALTPAGSNGLEQALERFEADHGSLQRFYDLRSPLSPTSARTFRQFYSTWRTALDKLNFDTLGQQGQIDFILLRRKLDYELNQLDREERRATETAALLPFTATFQQLREARQRVDPVVPQQAAATLNAVGKQIDELTKTINAGGEKAPKVSKTLALRAANSVASLRTTLRLWVQFYDGYDPAFSWWVGDPYKKLDAQLEKYGALVRRKLAGLEESDKDTILGDPVGRAALLDELAYNLIPYTPEELVAIANREFAWCDAEMLKASREMGFGDDWRKALEKVKTLHVAPGEQPALIVAQALEAIEFVGKRELVSVPQLARDTWRMEMMSPAEQRLNPFFLGGEVIRVSFPTAAMTQEEKLMSMRGNNIHFSRATVHHELIPGHFLQMFMNQRHRPYRRTFRNPFWTEGWALHWEMLLWDLGFPRSPEDRVGMLFWRMHRCARIIFSLRFHLGDMTAQQAVDFLVERVGHERENAAAEVRRSFESTYPPLYQSAYMLGALQFRALHKEMVGSGKRTNRQFHDAILELNSLPVEMVRAALTGERLARDFTTRWRFSGEVNPQ
jgi:uncharacterized protein (DUF885 family)